MADIKIAGRIKAGAADNIAGYASEILFDDQASNKTVKEVLEGKQDKLTFDNVPTEGSNKPVKSDGVYKAIQDIDVSSQISGKADKSEMSIVAGTGADADKITITLKNGTSATVLTQHQDVSEFLREGEVFGSGGDSAASFNSYADTVWNKQQTLSESQKQQVRENIGIADLETIRNGAAAGATAIQSVTVGTTTTGAAGSSASVVNSGTATAPVLDFTIPQGAQGVKGDTVIMGNEDTYTLYNTTGDAVDGAMTQQAVTRELAELAGKLKIEDTTLDFAIADENGYDIAQFSAGHIKTKNFDSSVDATTSSRGLMSAADKTKLETVEEGAEPNDVDTSYVADGDFVVTDENDYNIVQFGEGHLRTKNFNSKSVVNKLATIEEGAEVNDVNTETIENESDLSFSDEFGNILVEFKNGHIKTKNFDSNNINRDVTTDNASSDFNIADEEDNIIASFNQGHIKTKNFDSKSIVNKLKDYSLAEWSGPARMPKMETNPIAKVRFDAGMCRIFRKWGFVGDSWVSGTAVGKKVSVLNPSTTDNKAIDNGGIVDDGTSVITDTITITQSVQSPTIFSAPGIRLNFETNSELSGKVIMAKVSGSTYTALATGDTAKVYTIENLSYGDVVVISYPKTNVPEIVYQEETFTDCYDLSWGQNLVRMIGAEGYNFSVGGETAKRWCTGSGERRWNEGASLPENAKDVYIVSIGGNDCGYWLSGQYPTIADYPCVTDYPNVSDYGNLTITKENVLKDINLDDCEQNANSFAGWYAKILQRIKSVRKDAQIFCLSIPIRSTAYSEWWQTVGILVDIMNEYYGKKTFWFIDLYSYNDNDDKNWLYWNGMLNGHPSEVGYIYLMYQIATSIDWIIRNNTQHFKGSSLIGTGFVVDDYDTFLID